MTIPTTPSPLGPASLTTLLALLCLAAPSPAADIQLSLSLTESQVNLSWTSTSLTPTPPYLHYDFDLQESSDLHQWANATPTLAGGAHASSTLPLSQSLNRQHAARFYRVIGVLRMPGSNVSGANFTGADLKGANLAGANLSGADLSGANLSQANLSSAVLSGAQLNKANFDGANIEGVDLNTVPVAGLDLSKTLGVPRFTQVLAAPLSNAATNLPSLAYHPQTTEFAFNDVDLPGLGAAKSYLSISLHPSTTVSQLNALLSAENASILGCKPQSAKLGQGLLLLKLPTQTTTDLYAAAERLEQNPLLTGAAPDVLMAVQTIPDDANGALANVGGSAWNWRWDPVPKSWGGNWGLENARIPQMWNVREALIKAGVVRTVTAIIDVGFEPHADLQLNVVDPTFFNQNAEHGNHVAGIAGATHGNGLGIDGVNPFADLRGEVFNPSFISALKAVVFQPFDASGGLTGYGFVSETVDLLTRAPDSRILNYSLGFNWANRGVPLTLSQSNIAVRIANTYGAMFAQITSANLETLFICAAGNDYQLVPASISSPACNAGLLQGAGNVVVVEASDFAGNRSVFSNSGGTVRAPGTDILSLAPAGGYQALSGTSMASPFVSGLAGYLWAIDPNFSASQIVTLLRANGLNVDGFSSLMAIDSLPGHSYAMLRMLADLDDGSSDGNQREVVPVYPVSGDRAFEFLIGNDDVSDEDLDQDGGPGDGNINMADFRRWRDWLLYGEEGNTGNHLLNGLTGHPKMDANRNGHDDDKDEIALYPRGDFNGDGIMSRTQDTNILGPLAGVPLTDLEVLQVSGLWSDPDYDASDLTTLIDSVDFVVSAENSFKKNPDISSAVVWMFNKSTGGKVGKARVFTATNLVHLFTAPIDTEYFFASDPIDVGNRAFAALSSIGSFLPGTVDRGGDFAIDLICTEMTARFSTDTPEHSKVMSKPLESVVQAVLDELILPDPTANGPRAWANDQGTFYAWAKTLPLTDPPQGVQTLYSAEVVWKRAFTKFNGVKFPKFHVKPIHLRFRDQDTDTNELSAFAEIRLERRVGSATNAQWKTLFYSQSEIAGNAPQDGTPHTFRIVNHEGVLKEAVPTYTTDLSGIVFGMDYELEDYYGTISLSDLNDGDSFELRYTLTARALGPMDTNLFCDGECIAEAYVGDPLKYGSGMTMRYGDLGDLFELQQYSVGPLGAGQIEYTSSPNFYYVLYRIDRVTQAETPIAIQMGVVGNGTFVDPNPPSNATLADYRLHPVPLDRPEDTDQDGIDDLYEFARPAILSALDATDASEDPDSDQFTNLAEYQNGTNPEVVDAPPQLDRGLFPTQVRPGETGNYLRLADVNQDRVLDMIYISENGAIASRLGNPDGSFQNAVESDLTETPVFVTDIALATLDGDAFPDLAVSFIVNNSVKVFRGLGNGKFEPIGEMPTGSNPRRVAPVQLTTDSFMDLAVLNERSKTISVYLGRGDGTFTVATPVDLSRLGGFALDLVAGDFNADGILDLVATMNSNLAVMMRGQGDGSFISPTSYTVDIFPDHVTAGDFDGDGALDIATTSRSRGSASVLFNRGNATFDAEVRLPLAGAPLGAIAEDFNADGRDDLLIADQNPVVTQILSLAGRRFATPTVYSSLASITPVMADFDGDGLLDFLNALSGNISVAYGNADGSFEAGVAKLDIKSDWTHAQELVVPGVNPSRFAALNHLSNSVDVLEAAVPLNYVTAQSIPVASTVESMVVTDLNGDALPEAVAATSRVSFGTSDRGTNQLVILTGVAGGRFGVASYIPLSERPGHVLSGDWDGDGLRDLLVVPLTGINAVSFRRNASGVWVADPAVPILPGAGLFEVADLEGDGKAEIVMSGYLSVLQVYTWSATGFVLRQELNFTESVSGFSLIDRDGDGDRDLFAGTRDLSIGQPDALVSVFVGLNNSGTFAPTQLLATCDIAGAIAYVDINGDTRKDLVVMGQGVGAIVQTLLGNPAGGFESPVGYLINQELSSYSDATTLFIRDLNGNGKLDLLRATGSGIYILPHR